MLDLSLKIFSPNFLKVTTKNSNLTQNIHQKNSDVQIKQLEAIEIFQTWSVQIREIKHQKEKAEP